MHFTHCTNCTQNIHRTCKECREWYWRPRQTEGLIVQATRREGEGCKQNISHFSSPRSPLILRLKMGKKARLSNNKRWKYFNLNQGTDCKPTTRAKTRCGDSVLCQSSVCWSFIIDCSFIPLEDLTVIKD